MTDTATPPQTPGGSEHPSVVELSRLLDGELPNQQGVATSAHLEICAACRRQWGRLELAHSAVSSAGRPAVPPGADDRAVVAAMFVTSLSLVAKTAQGASAASGSAPTAASFGSLADSPPSPAAARLGEGTTRPKPSEVATASRPAQPASPRSGIPWLPAGQDASGARRQALVRKRRGRLLAQAAAAVLVLAGIGAGLSALLSSRHHQTLVSDGPSRTTTLPSAGIQRSTTTLPRANNGGAAGPALGALVLQLRPETGPSSCSRVGRHLESINGVFVAVNPAAGRSAVMAVPGPAGSRATCVAVGPAFATVWSGDIASLTVVTASGAQVPSSTTAAGPTVEVVIHLRSAAVTSAATFGAAETVVTTQVVAQGADFGSALVGSGPTITIRVSRSVADFLRSQLVAPS